MTLCRSNKPKAVQRRRALDRFILVLCLLGFVPPTWCEARVLFPFQGKIDFRQKQFSLLVDMENNASVSVNLTQKAANQFQVSVNINHLKTPMFDIASVLECPIEVVHNADGQWHVMGKLWSQYTLINYQPVDEIFGNFEIHNKTLFISSLAIGKIGGEGSFKFVEPYQSNLTAKFSDIDIYYLRYFIPALWSDNNTAMEKNQVSGHASGQIGINGPLKYLQVNGNLVSYDLVTKDSAFDNMVVNIEGVYPVINLVNSTGTKDNGLPFNIAGSIDLSKGGTFIEQIRALSKEAVVQKEGDNLEWTFKRIKSEEHGNSTTELKYLKKQSTETGNTPEESDMLGVERSVQF